ncbi:pentapeptide repeat-containing protein [Rothia nasisuis]|uniref:pentapeptide repeat-containing protein n=1 Tax=Rothia nasisuis TaxID=2109647 RepID=UPI001F40B858|nr:pentapeptide repeat-containing protein [Rothia nasisuis]
MAGNRLEEKADKNRDLSFWFVTLAWGTGAFVYGWLLAGILYDREYWKLTFEALGWADWSLAGLFGCAVGGLSFWASSAKESVKKESKQLFRIVVAVLPALFLVSALAVLVLTLATYNGDWKEARQGIATAFAALIAAVGVVVSVVVSYRTGEENRIAQQENLKTQLESQQRNLETQLEHQRALENDKGEREQQKLDAELIKNLNDRLHEIIPRRYGDKPEEVSASFFQLAALYKDWETLASNSDFIRNQRESQQRNILKLLFGVYQEQKGGKLSHRSELDIRTLSSVVQDILPSYELYEGNPRNVQNGNNESETGEILQPSFDLSYLDLRELDLSWRDLRNVNLTGAHLEGADLLAAHLQGVNLQAAHLEGANLRSTSLQGVNLWDAQLQGADLGGAHLKGANLVGAHLAGANLRDAHLQRANLVATHLHKADLRGAYLEGSNLVAANLQGAELKDAHLQGADLGGAFLEDTFFSSIYENLQIPEAREEVVNQLKAVEVLPNTEELLKAKDFDQALVESIIKAHKEHHSENQQ